MRKVVMLASIVLASALLHAQQPASLERPLPEAETFYEKVRENMTRSQQEQNRYAYKERRTDLHTNPFGRIGTGGTRLFEVMPDPDGLSATRRLIEKDHVPATDSSPERIRLPQRRAGGGSRNVEDIVQTLSFSIARREVVDGHDSIVIDFQPRPDAKPSTRQGRLARVFQGSMWVNESAHEVERVEATAIQDLSYGLGLLARVRKGATVSVERKPVEGGVWMLTALRFNGEGRALLFRKLNVDYAMDWFDYRLVDTAR
jgi:hypothetical protein